MKRHIAVFSFYAALACLALYWPLFHITTHVGYNSIPDYYQFHWNYWWIRHALTTPGLEVYMTDFLLYPAMNNLSFYTLVPFWFPLWAMFEPLVGTLPATNIVFLAAMALTGYVLFVLLRREGVPVWLALPFGVIWQITPSMLLSVSLTNLNYISMFWFPLQILIWGQVAKHAENNRLGLLWGTVQGIAFYGMMMTDYQHMLFISFLLIPYGILTLIQARGWQMRARLAGLGVYSLVLMTALLWFVGPLPYMIDFIQSDIGGTAPQPMEMADSIAFPEGFFWRLDQYSRKLSYGALVIPLMLLAFGVSVIQRQWGDWRRWFWFALAMTPLILTFGPYLDIANAQIPMPYILMHRAFDGLFRVPARFNIIAMLPAFIFIGRTFADISFLQRQRSAVAAGTLLSLLAFADGRLFQPMPIKPLIPQYSFYSAMGEETGTPYDSYVVVEVPVAGGSGEAWVANEFRHLESQFYGTLHQKRMLNATISRVPISRFWHWQYEDAMLAWLGQRRFLEPEHVEPQLRERIFEWPIGYIVVHQDLIPVPQEIIGYFNTLPDLLCPVYAEGSAVAYRTAWHPDDCPPRTPPEVAPGVFRIDIGTTGDERYTGWGWHNTEDIFGVTLRWTGQQIYDAPETHAQVYVDLPPGDYEIALGAQAYAEPRDLRLIVNGEMLDTSPTVAVEAMNAYQFDVPASVIGEGEHTNVTLVYDDTLSPENITDSEDGRSLAIAVDWIEFRRQGASSVMAR